MNQIIEALSTAIHGEALITLFGVIVFCIGVLAFITAVITQCIKEFPKIKALPTKLVSIIVGFIVTGLATIFAVDVTGFGFRPSYLVVIIFGGFFVGKIASDGWSDIKELKDRLIPKA